MNKVVLGFIISIVLGLLASPAQAAESDFSVTLLKPASCDQRAGKIEVTLTKKAQRVGYGYEDSDTIYWFETGGVSAGSHRYSFPRQPFGSMREWVPVAAFKDDQGLYTAPLLTLTRPAKADCVVKQNPRITDYSSDVNTKCGRGYDKMVIATLKVVRGSAGYIVAPGVAELVTARDRELRSLSENTSFVGGTGGTQRKVEYYFFTKRGARFTLDSSENGIWPVKTSSADVELLASLDAMCMSQTP